MVIIIAVAAVVVIIIVGKNCIRPIGSGTLSRLQAAMGEAGS